MNEWCIACTELFLPSVKDDENDMEVDTASSAPQATVKHSPELEIYCYLLVLIFLIDQKKYTEVSILDLTILNLHLPFKFVLLFL